MPKKSEATGATYQGHEGIVEDANQRLWEVDPSRNVDGTVVDGFESDERQLSGPDEATLPGKADDDLAVSETGSTGQEKPRSTKAEASDAENARASAGASGPEDVTADEKKEGASSAGSSSSASKTSPASSTQKTPGKK
jgi:hypothetical protein